MRGRLLEDLKAFRIPICEGLNAKLPYAEELADYLLSSGVIKELAEENAKLLNELKGAHIMPSEYEVLYKRKCEECESLKNVNEDLGNHCLDLENELQECVDIKTKALNEFTLRLAKAVGTYTKESYVYVHAWFTLVNKIIEDMIGEIK